MHNSKKVLASTIMVAAIAVCLAFVLDPQNADWGASGIEVIKFAPLGLISASTILLLLSIRFQLIIPFALIFCFTMLMVAGSMYSLGFREAPLEETYISRGLIASISFLGGYLVGQRDSLLTNLMPKIMILIVIYGWIAGILAVMYRLGLLFADLVQIYQVQTGLIAAALILTSSRIISSRWKMPTFVFLSIALLLIGKTTALLMLVCSLAVKFHLYVVPRLEKYVRSKAIAKSGIALLLFIALIVASAGLYQMRITDRGDQVREANALLRLGQFAEHPVVGDLYTGSPLVYYGPLHIPSHSEWLDLLASAGSLAFFFLIFPAIWLVQRASLLTVSRHGIRLRQWLALFVVLHAILMTVNPILFLPGLAIPFWLILGLLAGTHVTKSDFFLINWKLRRLSDFTE